MKKKWKYSKRTSDTFGFSNWKGGVRMKNLNMSWDSARKIAQLIQEDDLSEIQRIMTPYSLEQRQCITFIKHRRSSLLFIAVINCRVPMVIYFLEKCDADPNSFGYMGGKKLSCLAAATCINSESIVSVLLTHGANTELASSYQTTALLYACAQNRQYIAKCLIENGADVNSYNGIGENCLIESMYNIELFQYLISMGANINSVGAFGQTVLMMAIENQRHEIVSILLNCANTNVRLKNDCHEDAFCLALRYSSEDIINQIIEKGCYVEEEVIMAYELESCLFHIRKMENKSNELWEQAINLRAKSHNNKTLICVDRLLFGKLQEVVDLLEPDDVPTLLYLESVYGLNNIFILNLFTKATRNVRNMDKYITLCEFFFGILPSLEDNIYIGAYNQAEQLIQHYFAIKLSNDRLQILTLFNMFALYAKELRARFARMSPSRRTTHAHLMECFLYFTIEFIESIYRTCADDMHLFYDGIRTILGADLRGLRLKSLTQMCGRLHCSAKIMGILFQCRADVNSSDVEGKSVLHEVIDSSMTDHKIVEMIIESGFDFGRVKSDEYCLPCRMQRKGILPNPVKHLPLRCLATRTFCEKTMLCLSNIPCCLLPIIRAHLFLP